MTLNKEWLNDYKAREIENFGRFLKEFHKTGNVKYPPKSRFPKLKDPIADTTTEVWSVIPFYGSSLVHIFPSKRDSTLETSGWGTDRDIDNLIQLAKDTGRVQFILDKSPTDFEKHDYLEPLLRELQPPVNELIPSSLFEEKEYNKAVTEFTTLSGFKFTPFLKKVYDYYLSVDSIPPSFENFYSKHIKNYATLRVLGYDDIADTILNSLVDDPALAMLYSHFYGVLVADPKLSCFKLTYNPVLSMGVEPLRYITNEISELSQQTSIVVDLKEIELTDIGQFLFQNITLGAEGYLGCQQLIDKYEQQDTHKLLIAMQTGVKNKKMDVVKSNANELSEVLDNIWNDNKISNLSRGISYGIPLLFGTIGPMAAQSADGVIGILAGLGFRALDKQITPILTKSLSKGLARIFGNDELLAVYDFKKKYGIGDRSNSTKS